MPVWGIAAIVAGSVALGGAITALIWLVVRPGREVGRVTVRSGEPFRLAAEIEGEKVLTLWCDVDLAFEDALALRGPMRLAVDGRPVWNATFALEPMGATTAESSTRVKRVWIRTSRGVRGQARIAKIAVQLDDEGGAGPYRSAGERSSRPVVVEGTIEVGPGTNARKLDIVLAAR